MSNTDNMVWVTATAVVVMPDGSMTKLTQGDRWPADHPIVAQHSGWFSDDPRYGLPPVEQATAAPGERRNVRRG